MLYCILHQEYDTLHQSATLLNYNCSGCRCHHFGNSSKLSKNLEEYAMYGGLGLDKDKVISLVSVNSQVATKKSELSYGYMLNILFLWRNIKC